MSAAEQAPRPHQVSKQSGIAEEISSFVHNIGALQTAMPAQMAITAAIHIACEKSYNVFLKKNGEPDASNHTCSIGPDHFLEFKRLSSRLRKAKAATDIVPQTFIVALVSQYDSFLGGLLRRLYRARPEKLMQSDKHLTYSQLCDFADLEQAKEHILEKEIEVILRESHHDQFALMERRFDIPLKTGLPIWPVFVELTQRRNLFAHCNGQVSAQYLIVCDDHKVNYATRPIIGERLSVSPAYFDRAHDCIFEIGTKLAHVLWRKILPHEREEADLNLLNLGFDLLVAGHYDLAVTLGTFALKFCIRKESSDDIRRRMVVNLAQGYKWGGKLAEAAQIINGEDWSSCSTEFQLAVAVLRDDFDKAAGLMRAVAATGHLKKTNYRDWPLFNEFRKSQVFLDTYQSIYGHQPTPIEPSPTDAFFIPASKLRTMETTDGSPVVGTDAPKQAKSAEDSPAPNGL